MAQALSAPSFQALITQIRRHPDQRLEIVRSVDPLTQALLLRQLGKTRRRSILLKLTREEIVRIISQLDPNTATDLLQLLPHRQQEAIVHELDRHLADDISQLLPFAPDTAAGLMSLDYVEADEDAAVAQAAKRLQAHEVRTGRAATVIVTRLGRPIGYLPAHRLALAAPSEEVGRHARKIIVVGHGAHSNEVVNLFRVHPHDKAVVLGEDGNIMGIIYSDDVLRTLKEQEAASLYDFAGVNDEEEVTDPARRKIRMRYKWLIINLGTAFLAASTVGLFEDVLEAFVLLAVYMPIVAGMGGNAATQTLAVMVRGIALNQVRLRTVWPVLKNEVGSGLANGLINGVLVAAIVYTLTRDAKIALILAMAMVTNLTVAATFGTLVPLIMKRLGKDPATSATIFITTATDVLGFFAFLGLATLILL